MVFFARTWLHYVLWIPASSALEEIIYIAKCKTALGVILKRVILQQSALFMILQVQYILKHYSYFSSFEKQYKFLKGQGKKICAIFGNGWGILFLLLLNCTI